MGRITRGGGSASGAWMQNACSWQWVCEQPCKIEKLQTMILWPEWKWEYTTGCWDWIWLPQAGLEDCHRDLGNIGGFPLFTSALCEYKECSVLVLPSDMQQHECAMSWKAHDGEVYSVEFSYDENTVYSIGEDGKVGYGWPTGQLAERSLLESSPYGGDNRKNTLRFWMIWGLLTAILGVQYQPAPCNLQREQLKSVLIVGAVLDLVCKSCCWCHPLTR